MPDFNKGDFTQQGVNGHVNANVRLNEKRLVNIDLTSNEEAEGCTITGTVKDLLNDKVYAIGSGGGGGGMPFLTATIVNNTGYGLSNVSTCAPKAEYGVDFNQTPILPNSTEIKEYLYEFMGDDSYIARLYFEGVGVTDVTISYSNLVNCTFNQADGWLDITDPSENASATLTLTRESQR